MTVSRYDAKQDQWTNLPNIYQQGMFFHLVYVEPYLYAIGAASRPSSDDKDWNTLRICRCNVRNTFITWERCILRNTRYPDRPIEVYSDVGIVNECIYLVSSSICNLSDIKCFNPLTHSLKTVYARSNGFNSFFHILFSFRSLL